MKWIERFLKWLFKAEYVQTKAAIRGAQAQRDDERRLQSIPEGVKRNKVMKRMANRAKTLEN